MSPSPDRPEILDWDALARREPIERLQEMIEAGLGSQTDWNFAFQAACEIGRVEAAAALAKKASDTSLSRGVRKSAWSASPECARIAWEEISRRDAAIEDFDWALGWRDLRWDKPTALEWASQAKSWAKAESAAWALRELTHRRHWGQALALSRAWPGLWDHPCERESMEARWIPEQRQAKTPREAFVARETMSSRQEVGGQARSKLRAELEALELEIQNSAKEQEPAGASAVRPKRI